MKRSLRLFTSLASTALAFAALPALAQDQAPQFQFGGYARAGTGWSLKGGKQTCFYNIGSVANEFRLGNECSIYGEASLRSFIVRGATPTDPTWKSQLTFAYDPPGETQYEDNDSDTDGRDVQVIEAFVEGSGFIPGSPITAWAGKRFYRGPDVHMNDFFYFASMSGTGGGFGNIGLGFGQMKVAVLQEAADRDANGAPVRRSSQTGPLSKTALDVQIEKIPLTAADELHLWAVAAYTSPGYVPLTATSYEAGQGYVGGVRWHRSLENGFNDLAVAYGTGVMSSLEMVGGSAIAQGSGVNDSKRLRVVEHLTIPIGTAFATHFAATYEDRDNGRGTDRHSQWWNVGVRPVYFVTDNFNIAAEIGHSVVRSDTDRAGGPSDTAGARIGDRQLTRFTIAPQLAIQSNIMARPVIRFFVTHSRWNDDNKNFVTKGGPAYVDENSGTSVGVQSEVWF